MAAKFGDKSKWKRKKSPQLAEEDNDCASLAWLLNFRLDEIVNVKVLDENQDDPKSFISPPIEPEISVSQKKPPYTYPELIERALREKGELTVSALYQWISDRFPFYKANDERWKNSVRHNLSINPHFRKGARAPQGAGHLWSLDANAIDLLPPRRHGEEQRDTYKDRDKHAFEGSMPRVDSCWSIAANASELTPLRNSHVYIDEHTGETIHEAHVIECPKVIVLDEAAIAAASILPDNELFTGSTMFLNPVSTEQVVRECGLITVD